MLYKNIKNFFAKIALLVIFVQPFLIRAVMFVPPRMEQIAGGQAQLLKSLAEGNFSTSSSVGSFEIQKDEITNQRTVIFSYEGRHFSIDEAFFCKENLFLEIQGNSSFVLWTFTVKEDTCSLIKRVFDICSDQIFRIINPNALLQGYLYLLKMNFRYLDPIGLDENIRQRYESVINSYLEKSNQIILNALEDDKTIGITTSLDAILQHGQEGFRLSTVSLSMKVITTIFENARLTGRLNKLMQFRNNMLKTQSIASGGHPFFEYLFLSSDFRDQRVLGILEVFVSHPNLEIFYQTHFVYWPEEQKEFISDMQNLLRGIKEVMSIDQNGVLHFPE